MPTVANESIPPTNDSSRGPAGEVAAESVPDDLTTHQRELYFSPELADLLDRLASDPDAISAGDLPASVTLRPVPAQD